LPVLRGSALLPWICHVTAAVTASLALVGRQAAKTEEERERRVAILQAKDAVDAKLEEARKEREHEAREKALAVCWPLQCPCLS
jgi:hypothetical protein